MSIRSHTGPEGCAYDRFVEANARYRCRLTPENSTLNGSVDLKQCNSIHIGYFEKMKHCDLKKSKIVVHYKLNSPYYTIAFDILEKTNSSYYMGGCISWTMGGIHLYEEFYRLVELYDDRGIAVFERVKGK